jgi:hypothetical protein
VGDNKTNFKNLPKTVFKVKNAIKWAQTSILKLYQTRQRLRSRWVWSSFRSICDPTFFYQRMLIFLHICIAISYLRSLTFGLICGQTAWPIVAKFCGQTALVEPYTSVLLSSFFVYFCS